MGIFGFINKKRETTSRISSNNYRSVSDIYTDFYAKAVDICIKGAEEENKYVIQSDLGALLYVIVDMAAINSGKDRYQICNENYLIWRSLVDYTGDEEIIRNQFQKRVEFYSEFARGKAVVMEYWTSSNKPNVDNPVTACTAAFCDVLYNPIRKVRYDKALAEIKPITTSIEYVQNVFMPLNQLMVQLNNTVYSF